MDKVQFITSLEIFKDCSKEIIIELVPLFKQHDYKEGSIIFKEDTVGEDVYIIYSGQVEIIKNYGKTNQKLLRVLNEKSIFGEMALFTIINRTATALSKTDSVIFSINSQQFKNIFKKFAEDGLKIIQWMLLNIGLRLEQTSKELAAINTISFMVIESLQNVGGLKIFLTKVCNEIYNVVGSMFSVGIYVYNIFIEEFELVNNCGEIDNVFEQSFDIKNNFVNIMMNEKKSYIHEETNGIKKFFCPMIFTDKIIGFVLVATFKHLSQDVKDLISSITNLLTVAIANLKQLEEEREKQKLRQMKDRYMM